MNNLKIKVCGMKDPDNLNSVIELNPDFVGFIFHQRSPRYIGDTLQPSLTKQFDCKKVGVFVDSEYDEIQNKIRNYNLDFVQLHGKESPGLCSLIGQAGVKVIKSFSIGQKFDAALINEYYEKCDYFLFDTAGANPGGNGISFDWDLLNQYTGETPFFLSGGLGPESIPAIMRIENPKMYGIDVNSKVESSAGIKDIQKLSTTIKLLKQ